MPKSMYGSNEESKKLIDMMSKLSKVWFTYIPRNYRAYWKLDVPILPDSSTKKFIDCSLLQGIVTESIKYAL